VSAEEHLDSPTPLDSGEYAVMLSDESQDRSLNFDKGPEWVVKRTFGELGAP